MGFSFGIATRLVLENQTIWRHHECLPIIRRMINVIRNMISQISLVYAGSVCLRAHTRLIKSFNKQKYHPIILYCDIFEAIQLVAIHFALCGLVILCAGNSILLPS